jgi:integrase-like protein
MHEDNLVAIRRRKFVVTTDSDHQFRIHPNLVQHLELTDINQLWVADLTYLRLEQEFAYVAVVLDAYSRRVIGWELGRSLEGQLTLNALEEGDHHTAAAARFGASLRSRHPIRFAELRGSAGSLRCCPEHEPSRLAVEKREVRALSKRSSTRNSKHGSTTQSKSCRSMLQSSSSKSTM